jgi:transposase
MFSVELYGRVRHACQIEGLSQREAARRFGLHRNTVRKMLAFSVPPGYRRSKPAARPKLDPFTPIIDGILEADGSAPPKQRHTAKRIYERLRAEHGYAGGYTTVKDYVREQQARAQEVFVPLVHPPGHAQVDFGEAVAVIGGVRQKIHFFCLDLPHSDAGFVKAYPAERIEAFCDGHNAAFAFLGGVPQSILYDNTKLAVARILSDGTRQRTRSFAELQSHYLFRDRFGRARATTRARSRAWSAMPGATPWCPSQTFQASQPSTRISSSAVWSGWITGCAVRPRASASDWCATWRLCKPAHPRHTKPATAKPPGSPRSRSCATIGTTTRRQRPTATVRCWCAATSRRS